MNRGKAWWMAAVAVIALVVVVGPAILPFGAGPTMTPTPAPQSPVTNRTSLASTTTEPGEPSAGQHGWSWRRIDPETLEDVASSSLFLGAPGRGVFSLDGHSLASFVYRNSDNSEELVVADLKRWRIRDRLPLEGWVVNDQSGLVDGPVQATFLDETDVVTWIAQLPSEQGSGPVAEDYALFRYSLGAAQPELSYGFPPGFAPWEMRLLSRDRIAVFGSPVVFDEEAAESARWTRLFVIDAITGRLAWEVQIPELAAGHQWKGDSVGSFMHPGLGWDLAGQRLYVAHADRLAVTVVDLSQGVVIGEKEISLPTSMEEQLKLLLLPLAQAKLQEGTRRNVRVDPQGERLFVSGVRWELVHNDQGEATDEQQVALGLTVLDLPTLETVSHLDLPVSDVEISPDGSILLLTGVWDGQVVDSDPEQSGLYVLDAGTLEQRRHLWPGTIPWIHAFSNDGSSVYVSVFDGDAHLKHLDLLELDVLAERVLSPAEQTSFELARRGLTAIWVER